MAALFYFKTLLVTENGSCHEKSFEAIDFRFDDFVRCRWTDHDGNLESLAGDFIYLPENNRAVATDSWGLIEALKFYFHADRLVNELRNGKM